MQKHARTSAERRRRNRFSFRSFLSASVIKIGGGFLSNVSFSSRRRSCCCCRDIDADTEEEEAEEEAIALDIGRDIFCREKRDDFFYKHAPQQPQTNCQNRKKKVQFSSLLSEFFFRSLFFAQTTNSLVKKEKNNDRLRSHDCTRTRPGHPHESRNDERDEEEIGYLATMGERFKGIII